MGRRRQVFSLYRRTFTLKDGKQTKVWYYHCFDEAVERLQGRSTGFTNKRDAERHVLRLFRDGELVPVGQTRLKDYARDFWVWGKCSYCRLKLAKSKPGKPKISERHANDMRSAYETYVAPRFGDKYLSAIRRGDIEKWFLELSDQGLSGKRINNIAGSFRVILRQAKDHDVLSKNPFDNVEVFEGDGEERGTLALEEVRTLFAPEALENVWSGNRLHFTVNLLAASTGLRLGEILALRSEDLHDDHIHVAHSWHSKYGLQPTKTRQERDVPLPARVRKAIQWFADANGDGFLFCYPGQGRPAANNALVQGLYRALRNLGVSDAERKRRKIVFHSWRHWWASLCQARGIPAPLTQSVVGHATDAMLNHYGSHFRLEDYQPVAALQEEVFAI